MKKKKWVILLLCLAVLLTGCGRKLSEEATAPTKQKLELVEETEPKEAVEEQLTEPAGAETEPSDPASTQKPKENETSWEDSTVVPATAPSNTNKGTGSETSQTPQNTGSQKATEAPTEDAQETTEPAEAPTKPTEAPQVTEPEDENVPQPNTEPGWGELQ